MAMIHLQTTRAIGKRESSPFPLCGSNGRQLTTVLSEVTCRYCVEADKYRRLNLLARASKTIGGEMSELTDVIDKLRQVARRFTEHADQEERSPYYADQSVKAKKVTQSRDWAVRLEDAANTVTAVKVEMDKHE